MRGGAYAILMAFYHSSTKTLSKPQICQLAQPYCDEDMDGDFHAGRMHGAWAANKTLLKHHLLTTEGNNRQYIHGVGFRSNGCAAFTLTRDGEQFTDAMLRKFGGATQQGATARSSSTMTKAAVFSAPDPFTGTPPLVTAHSPSRRNTMKAEFVSPVKRTFAGTGHKLDDASPGKRIRPAEAAAAAAFARAASQDSKRISKVVPRSLFTPTSQTQRTFKSEKAAPAGRKLFNDSVTVMLEDSDDELPPPSHFAKKQPPEVPRRLLCGNLNAFVLSEDSDSDSDDYDGSRFVNNAREIEPRKETLIVDLCGEEYDSKVPAMITAPKDVIILESDDDDKPTHQQELVVNPYDKENPPEGTSREFTFCIDDRERIRNAAPRRLRTELNRLLETGCLKSVWPEGLNGPGVTEKQLRFGDFSFLLGSQRLDVVVERKQIRDLVQRSTQGDHWKQLAKMRDNFRHAMFLIEVDPREAARFTAHGSQNLEGWNAYDTVIDDEKSYYLFMCRALLSHRSVKFIQTREFQSSLRAIGALGMMAAFLEIVVKEDPEHNARPVDHCAQLKKRLTAGGLPDALADRVARECGSARHLDSLYHECVDQECKERLMLPLVESVAIEHLAAGEKSSWSEAIFRTFYSLHTDVTVAATSYRKYQPIVTDHGELLSALHMDLDAETALDDMLSKPKKVGYHFRRRVNITLCQDQAALLPLPKTESFFTLETSVVQPFGASVPTMVFRTSSGTLCSSNLFVHIVSGSFFVNEVKAAMRHIDSAHVKVARLAGSSILKACSVPGRMYTTCRKMLIIQGMSSAVEAEAKKSGYQVELKTLLDVVTADLMLEHDVVVIQAFRQNAADVKIILEQLTLACFHYQMLTEKSLS
jgi:ERCC4-type nuclease